MPPPDVPEISVITPSFRQVDWLRLCAASVADQAETTSVEHIVQDGCTGGEFAQWAAGQTFAQCHTEPDKGMYDAINRGFRKARGEILCWLNCDEQYLPGSLKKVNDFFDQHPQVHILFGDVIVAGESFQPKFYRKAVKPLPAEIRHSFLSTYSAATFIRRRVIDDGHLLDDSFRAIADAVWIHRLLKQGYRAAVLDEPLALFLLTGSNLGQSPAAIEESAIWRQQDQPGPRLMASLHRQIHRVRKSMAGGYRIRHIDTAVYMPGHVGRQPIIADIGGRWKEGGGARRREHGDAS